MSLYGTLAEPPPPDEARVLFDGFVGRLDSRRAWFVEQVAAGGGPATDGSPGSLDPLLDHVVSRLREPGREANPPDWFARLRPETGWTDRGAALVEGLIAYTAALVTAETGATWQLDEDPRSAFAGQPVLSDRTTPPWHLVLQAVRRTERDPRAKKLERAVRANLAAVAGSGPTPDTPEAEPLDVEITPVRHPGWDYQASIPEWAEETLGQEAFDGLVDRFRAVDGVQDALHEDREIFLLRAAGVDAEQLRSRLQAVLDAAAR